MLLSIFISWYTGGNFMKKNILNFPKRSIAVVLALVLLVGIVFMVPTQAASDTANVGKLVDYFQANSSIFTLNANSRFFLATEPTGELLQTVQLAQRQFAADGIPSSTPMDIVWGDTAMLRAGDIFIQIVSGDNDIGVEGYKIVVTNYATVTAEDVDGLLYGLNNLQKHFRNGKSNSIKGFTTYDTPDTRERTVQLDCARKYLTKEYICNFVKEMSWMGYNTLQLHVSEDGGYRADLWDPAYYVEGRYQPENDFSWLCGSKTQSWTHNSTLTGVDYRVDPDANKYLTTAELVEIFNVCKEYHIDVIPSFDSPGHMDYLTWKFEQNYLSNKSYSFKYNGTTYNASATSGCINYVGQTGGSYPLWPQYTSMDIRDDTTRGKMSQAFVFSIYKDMADFFKYYAGSTKFNIGTDEVNLTNSAVSSKAWSYSLFPGYVNELTGILKAKGYTVRMFNDFINENNVSSFDSSIEILYWNSPYNSITGKAGAYNEPSVAAFVNNGRVLYNCINQHTYYVLRINDSQGDARSKTCYQWEFYGADEQSIYYDWTPNNIRKKGKYTEPDAIVPTSQLGGAYFLTWHDYAAVNTETEMWNGVWDNAKKTGEFYSLRDRMWSNSIKMWNWDINKTLTAFSDFATIRNTLGDFPGLQDDTYPDNSSYAKATSLPASTDPIHLADHTTLSAALVNKISKGNYTSASYSVYENAYNQAILVNNNNRATAEELGLALTDLNNAIAGLTVRTNTITVNRKTVINGTTYSIDTLTYALPVGQSSFELYVASLNGYDFQRVEGATYTQTPNGDGSGYLTGGTDDDVVITMWYTSNVTVSRLNALIADAITEQGNFSDDSWSAYATALSRARSFSLSVNTLQSEVDNLVKALEDARSTLVIPSKTTEISVEKLAESFQKGNQIGLRVYTSSNVPKLIITDEQGNMITPDFVSGEVQELNNGKIVKCWLIFLPAEAAGTFTYTVSYNQASDSVTVTVN